MVTKVTFALKLMDYKFVESVTFESLNNLVIMHVASGPVYKFLNARGQGGFLKWDFTSW